MANPTNANILRALKQELSFEVQNHLPSEVSDNLQKVYDTILNFAPVRNEIVPSMVNRIGMQTVDSIAWRNPLARFKKEPMRYGETHEETYVNMCKGRVYDSQADFKFAFQQYQSYIMSMFHNVNLEIQYPVTITYDNLRKAFTTEYGIRDMIMAKMESAITGANWDEYLAMRDLINVGYEKEVLPAVTVDAVTNEETAKKLLVEVKRAVGEFGFPLPENNTAGATSHSMPSNLIWVTTPNVNAHVSVDALAYAFHMDRADVEVQTVIVDKFSNPAIQGVLCDVRFFNVREQFKEMTDQKLANVLSWNYFYTQVEMVSASPFYPIRVFTTDTVVEKPTLEVATGTYTPGQTQEVKITVSGGTGEYHQNLVTLEVESGATSAKTYVIPGTHLLHTGADETGTIVLKAIYRPNVAITKTADFTKQV
jgi:hypothetical protein